MESKAITHVDQPQSFSSEHGPRQRTTSHIVLSRAIIRSLRSLSMLLGQVDILITVSGFASTPSLSSAVACHFAMRSDVKAFSLSGHGCAGGLVGIELAQALLSVRSQRPRDLRRSGCTAARMLLLGMYGRHRAGVGAGHGADQHLSGFVSACSHGLIRLASAHVCNRQRGR